MSQRPIIATPGQEQHMRATLETLREQRAQSLSAWSETLIGSTRLLDFQRGAPLTNMLLSRVLIGLKAQGLSMTRERLLGPEELPPALVVPETPSEQSDVPPDPLLTCVQCLINELTTLREISAELTVIFRAIVRVVREEDAKPPGRVLPFVFRDGTPAEEVPHGA